MTKNTRVSSTNLDSISIYCCKADYWVFYPISNNGIPCLPPREQGVSIIYIVVFTTYLSGNISFFDGFISNKLTAFTKETLYLPAYMYVFICDTSTFSRVYMYKISHPLLGIDSKNFVHAVAKV